MEIRRELAGVHIVITGVDTRWRLRCAEDCREQSSCPLRRLCGRPGDAQPRLALVSVTVENPLEQPFSLSADAWELVDRRGFAVGGVAVCERLLPVGYVQADLWSVTPGTRVRTMLAFPLGDGVREIICSEGEDRTRFPIDGNGRQERLKGKPVLRLKKRGSIRITECWSQRDEDGERRYVFIGRKK